jgi:hypothetical protein
VEKKENVMGDTCVVVVLALLLCTVIGHRYPSLRVLHPLWLWRRSHERAQQRFCQEMCMRWGVDPIPRWHHDERERSREMRVRRAPNAPT